MTIHHLVLSGGGGAGFITYGALKYLEKEKFWNIKDIKSMYGSSIGAVIGIAVLLGYEWEWLDDYIIKRPWNKVFEIDPLQIFDIYKNKGLYDTNAFYKVMEPLLKAKEISPDVSLKEFYELTKIDIHVISVNINDGKFESVDISHKTHPDYLLIESLAMSACFPLLIKPILKEGCCYIDGGFLNNFPLENCIKQEDCKLDEILGINLNTSLSYKNTFNNEDVNNNDNNYNSNIDNDDNVKDETNVFEYLKCILSRMYVYINKKKIPDIPYLLDCKAYEMRDVDSWIESACNEELRKECIINGEKQAKEFLDILNNKD